MNPYRSIAMNDPDGHDWYCSENSYELYLRAKLGWRDSINDHSDRWFWFKCKRCDVNHSCTVSSLNGQLLPPADLRKTVYIGSWPWNGAGDKATLNCSEIVTLRVLNG